MPECVICSKELSKGSFNVKDKYELSKGGFICKECAKKIGIKGIMSASLYTRAKARQKYCDMYPDEAQRYGTVNPAEEAAIDATLDEQFIKTINAIPNCHIILRNELKQLRRLLNDGEEVIYAVSCVMSDDCIPLYDGKSESTPSSNRKSTWVAALTNTRILLVNSHLIVGTDCISMPLESINSVSCRVGIGLSTITILHGISCLALEHVNHGEEKIFVDKANEAISKARRSTQVVHEQPPAPVSSADELVKWHELLKQGIITQEEFGAQKAKLLK